MAKALFYDNPAPSVIIGVNERVGEAFTNGLVDRCVVNAVHILVQGEGSFDIGSQAGGNP